jgi:hypothetical protein
MLQISGKLEKKKVVQLLSMATCAALQTDGSTNWQNKDNKFVTLQYILQNWEQKVY